LQDCIYFSLPLQHFSSYDTNEKLDWEQQPRPNAPLQQELTFIGEKIRTLTASLGKKLLQESLERKEEEKINSVKH